MDKRVLAIKEWGGSGTGDLKFEIGTYMLVERSFGSKKTNKLVVVRKPDSHSSRFGMKASLNAQNHTLSWGFTEMNLVIDKTTNQGKFISRRLFVFISIAVESSKINGDEEEITFVFNEKSELCFGQC